MIIKQISWIFFLTILFVSPEINVAQSIELLQSKNYTIHWIGDLNESSDIQPNPSIFKKALTFISGKKNVRFIKPMSLARLSSEKLVVLDQGLPSIFSINFNEHDFTSFECPVCPSLVDITSMADSLLFFTDSGLGKIFYREKDKNNIKTFNENTPLQRPTGIVYSEYHRAIFVTETGAHRICVFDLAGNLIRTIGKRGVNLGEFNFPTFLAADSEGNIYIVDSMNFRVQVLNPDGDVISCFGKPGNASGYLARPKGIACDSFGHIFVVDGLFHNVQIFDRDGNFLEKFGKQGRGPGEFWMPTGILIDRQNKIYIADTYNARVQIFQLEGRI